ncbi:MAG: amidohydrolase [Pseudomonadota bacterium]
MKLSTAVLVASALCAPVLAAPMSESEVQDLERAVAADYDARLEAAFKDFHAMPELSFRESRTAERMADELEALGYEVTRGIGRTGVVAVLENGQGPTVLIRADMDGLPLLEETGLPYASRHTQRMMDGTDQPVMHACGHDVHITSLLGTAKQMQDRHADWSGTLVLIVQPAEETGLGAKAMIADGLYTDFPKPDYAIAFHVASELEAGRIVVPAAAAFSSDDVIDLTVFGVGTHGASPHLGIDPVVLSAAIVMNLQTIVSRRIGPRRPAVVTVGSIHGGTKHNIIGENVKMELTVRSDDFETRKTLLDSIERIVRNTALAYDVPENRLPTLTYLDESSGPGVNDAETAAYLAQVISARLPERFMTEPVREGMGAEDFASLVEPQHGVEGVYMFVGGTPAEELDTAAGHHSPLFKVEPEASIRAGTEVMTLSAMALFGKDKR